MKKDNVLKEKSFLFVVRIISFYRFLVEKKKKFIMAKQILRSGTSIGAMVEEANQAERKADFIHKLSIANKEANETHYRIRLLQASNTIQQEAISLLSDCEELMRLLTAIFKSAKQNLVK